MTSKENIEKEHDARLDALEKKLEHDQMQLMRRHEREKQMIERRYENILKSFEKRPVH